MKNLLTYLSYLPKKLFTFVAATLAIIGLGVAVQAAFGPSRPTYTWEQPADHITFNSITNNPTEGDERAFLTASSPGAEYKDPVNDLQAGDELALKVYYHNNAAASLGKIATNTAVRIAMPTGSGTSRQVTAYISADNATPQIVFDTVDLALANGAPFELEYVAGSAKLQNEVFVTGTSLPDSIIAGGALIGYDSLNGKVPGCSQYSGWVTLRLKVKTPQYTISKKARLAGEGTDAWRETVNAQAGDTVEWRIDITNTGGTTLKNVIVSDLLPANMNAEKGSVKLIDSNFPPSNPYVYPDSAISIVNGKYQVNVTIGDYPAGSNAVVTFKSKVESDKSVFSCGENRLTNAAYATPQGYGSIVDEAYVTVTKDCGQPVYRCDALSVTKLSGRQIKADVAITANNGASLTTITYSFGDGSTDLVTTNSTVNYTYAKDGTFTIKAVPSFKIGNQVFTAPSNNCAKQVVFGTPKEIPNTGAGSMLGIFAGTSVLGAIAYRLRTIRRLSR